jgi:hypothetical protein
LKELVEGAIDTGLADSAPLTRIASKLIEGSGALLPPDEFLPQVAAARNASSSSNSLYAKYAKEITEVAGLTASLEQIMSRLSHAIVKNDIPGELQKPIFESNYVMAVRRVLPTDESLHSELKVPNTEDSFFLPVGLLSAQDPSVISEYVDYQMVIYNEDTNPFLSQSPATSRNSYLSKVLSLRLYGHAPVSSAYGRGRRLEEASTDSVELNVQGLESNIEIKMAIPKAQNYYGSADYWATCQWFDKAKEDDQGGWSYQKCTAKQVSNASITCSCNHLTNFAAFIEESEEQRFLESCKESPENCVDGEIWSETPPGILHAMIMLVAIFVIYLVGVSWGYKRDLHLRKLERRARLKIAASQRGRSTRGGSSTRGTDSYGGNTSGAATSRPSSLLGRSESSAKSMNSNSMLGGRHKRVRWRNVLKGRLVTRHLWLSMCSKRSMPFYSRSQQATVLLTVTLASSFWCSLFLYKPETEANTTTLQRAFDPGSAVASGLISALLVSPLVNMLSYLFILCGRLKHSVLDSSRYGKKKWRPTSVYALLWLSTILYAFCVLVCICCAFMVLLYGTKMDVGTAPTWTASCAIAIFTEAVIIRPIYCALEAAWTLRKPSDEQLAGARARPGPGAGLRGGSVRRMGSQGSLAGSSIR